MAVASQTNKPIKRMSNAAAHGALSVFASGNSQSVKELLTQDLTSSTQKKKPLVKSTKEDDSSSDSDASSSRNKGISSCRFSCRPTVSIFWSVLATPNPAKPKQSAVKVSMTKKKSPANSALALLADDGE